MQIKRLEIEDEKLVYECDKLFKDFLDSEGKYDTNYLKRENISSFLGDLDNTNIALLCGILGDEVVAFLYGYIEKKKGMKEEVAHISFVYVKEEYRKRNIATELINEYIKILKERNITIIEVKSFNDNIAARKLYSKFGFDELWTNYRTILKK